MTADESKVRTAIECNRDARVEFKYTLDEINGERAKKRMPKLSTREAVSALLRMASTDSTKSTLVAHQVDVASLSD